MTAIVAGQGLGLINTSLGLLGGQGQLGSAAQGRSSEQVVVNATTGNLVVQQQDEWLVGIGPDIAVSRTYNSLGAGDDDNGDNWRLGYNRKVVGTSGSDSVIRVGEDGNRQIFAKIATDLYQCTEGSGSYDQLRWNAGTSTWIWTDGSSQATETYKQLVAGQGDAVLQSIQNVDAQSIVLSYDATTGLITKIKDANGEYIQIDYDATTKKNIQSLTTYNNLGTLKLKRVSYTYDSNRLKRVIVDLSPDNGTVETTAFVTDYTYEGTTNRLRYLKQGTLAQLNAGQSNSTLEFQYDGTNKISKVIETVGGTTQTTSFAYNTTDGVTTITDPNNQVTKLTYDTSTYSKDNAKAGQLKQITYPAVGGTTQTISYDYDAKGNVLSTTDGRGSVVNYQYDANGNRTLEQDAQGNVVERKFGSRNELLTETAYTVAASTGQAASGALTTRYVYDSNLHLRFVLSPTGNVLEHQYHTSGNGLGQRKLSRQFLSNAYDVSSLAKDATPLLADLVSWAQSPSVDLSKLSLSEFAYDAFGQLSKETSYSKTSATDGSGVLSDTSSDSRRVVQYVYDQAGNLLKKIDSRGDEVLTRDTAWARLMRASLNIKDVNGNGKLVQDLTASDKAAIQQQASFITVYAYDGLNRITRVTEPQLDGSLRIICSVTSYDDALRTTTQFKTATAQGGATSTLTEVATSVSTYDEAGHLLSLANLSSDVNKTDLGTTQYTYDKLGRVVMVKTPATTGNTGEKTYYLYDAMGRKTAQIDPEGAVIEYSYNQNNQVIRTMARANQVNLAGMDATATTAFESALKNGTATLSTLSVTADTQDRYTWNVYDKAGRLILAMQSSDMLVPGDMNTTRIARMTEYLYDGAGRLVQKRQYANPVRDGANGMVDQVAALKAYGGELRWVKVDATKSKLYLGALDTDTSYTVRRTNGGNSTADSVERYYYDANGLRIGELDAENGYTAYVYDKAARLISSTKYAQPVSTVPSDGSAPAPIPTLVGGTTVGRDQTTRYIYDGKGQLTGQVDDASYYTAFEYDGASNRVKETRYYAQQVAGFDGSTAVKTDSNDRITSYQYDGDNRLTSATTQPTGQKISYGYDVAGRLTSTVTSVHTGFYALADDQRKLLRQYDALGRVTRELSAEGAKALDALTGGADTQPVWDKYATQYLYDNAGRRVATIVPNGKDGNGNKTAYYYDKAGHLVYSINSLGEVTQYSYNAFGQQIIVSQYATRAAITTNTLAGGLASQFTVPAQTASDALTNFSYTGSGELETTYVYGTGASIRSAAPDQGTAYSYDGKGGLREVDTAKTWVSYDTDRRGLRTSAETQAITPVLGLVASTQTAYDAFGRVTSTTDAKGMVSNTIYNVQDTGGRSIEVRAPDALGSLGTLTTYDAFGRELTVKDRNGSVTKYAYDDASGLVTVIHPDTKKSYHVYDSAGELVASMDAQFNSVDYIYDKDGRVTSVTTMDATGNEMSTVKTRYDMAGRIDETQDARGIITKYSYDKAGRVLSRTVDNAGLKLATLYRYDTKGQAVWTRDPNGVWTQTTYSRKGNVLTMVVDPESVPSAADAADEAKTSNLYTLVANSAAGGALAIKTSYTYDTDGHQVTVIRQKADGTGPALKTTYKYDELGRRSQEIVDDTGLALSTAYDYDLNGRVVKKIDAGNYITRYVYDEEGRQRYVLDGMGALTQYTYELNGQVSQVRRYANLLASIASNADEATAEAAIVAAGSANVDASKDQVTTNVYDSMGRLALVRDAFGGVTQYSYDANSNLVLTTRYAKAAGLPTQDKVAGSRVSYKVDTTGLADATKDQVTRSYFDAANRQTWSLQYDYDAVGATQKIYATHYAYDKAGNIVETRRFASLVQNTPTGTEPKIIGAADTAPDASICYVRMDDSNDQVTYTTYDNANRVRFAIDGERYVTESTYDNDGHLTSSTRYAKPAQLGAAFVPGCDVSILNAGDATTNLKCWVFKAGTSDTSKDVVTSYGYDNAGHQLTQQTKELGGAALQSVRKAYDALGNVTDVIDASGTGQDVTTHYNYDTAGRVIEEIKAFGKLEQASTRYVLDKLGQRVNIIDPRGVEAAEGTVAWAVSERVRILGTGTDRTTPPAKSTDPTSDYQKLLAAYKTIQQFDANGHVIQGKDPLGGTTETKYDAFGNAVRIKDPNGNYGYFIFDQLNQSTWQIDPMGYATQTNYNVLGQVTSIIKYANKVENLQNVLPASAVAPAAPLTDNTSISLPYLVKDVNKDATTNIAHDVLGRQTKIQDAEGYYESMTYDALGNKRSYTVKSKSDNKNEVAPSNRGTYTYKYDRKGLLIEETLPEQVASLDKTTGLPVTGAAKVDVINKYQYDARGNRTKSTEAFGLYEQRITNYKYDALDRQVEKTGEAMGIYTVAGGDQQAKIPTESKIYDARGDLIESKAADGGRTLSYYDALNRKIAEVGPTGMFTTYAFDATDNIVQQRIYGDVITPLPTLAGGNLPLPVNASSYRETLFKFDARSRQTDQVVTNVTVYTKDAGASTQNLTTTSVTDANGNVVKVIDPRGNATYSYFDKAGNKTAQVDAMGYVTKWEYFGSGAVKRLTQYDLALDMAALKTRTGADLSENTKQSDIEAVIVDGGETRVTEYTYDKLNHLLSESRLAVSWSDVDALSGNKIDKIDTSTTSYSYNGLGQILTKTDASGGVTTLRYDKQSRLVETMGAAFTDYRGQTVRQTEDIEYNGLGLQYRNIQRGEDDAVETDDRITVFGYGTNGVLTSEAHDLAVEVNGRKTITKYQYDLAGHITRKMQDRTDADGKVWTDRTTYTYDQTGQQTKQSLDSKLSTDLSWTFVQSLEAQYNAYGQISAKGTNGGWQEKIEYDQADRVWRTNSGTTNGATEVYYYDQNGNLTLKIGSLELNLLDQTVLYDCSPSSLAKLPAKFHYTAYAYNKDNKLTDTTEQKISAITAQSSNPYQSASAIVSETIKTNNIPQDPFVSGSISAGGTIYYMDYASENVVHQYYSFNDIAGINPAKDMFVESVYTGMSMGMSLPAFDVPSTWVSDLYRSRLQVTQAAKSYAALHNISGIVYEIIETYAREDANNTATRFTAYQDNGSGGRLLIQNVVADPATFSDAGQGFDASLAISGAGYTPAPSSTISIQVVPRNAQNVKFYAWPANNASLKVELSCVRAIGPDLLEKASTFLVDTKNLAQGDWKFHYDAFVQNDIVSAVSGAFTIGPAYIYPARYNTNGDVYSAGIPVKANGAPKITSYSADVRPDIVLISHGISWATQGESASDVTIKTSQNYNAFGEVKEVIDGNFNKTTYTYSKGGLLIRKQEPSVMVRQNNGLNQSVLSPTTEYFYDKAGRMVANKDASGNITTMRVRVDSFLNQPVVVSEFHTDKTLTQPTQNVWVATDGVKRNYYDIFGDLRRVASENWLGSGDDSNYVTKYKYDKQGHLLEIDRPGSSDESYEYDEAGNRIANTLAPNKDLVRHREKAFYDALGRVSQSANAAGRVMTYAYVWDAAIAGGGGWRITTSDSDNALTLIDDKDIFGRLRWHKDLGNHVFTYTYNQAGLLINQTSKSGDVVPSKVTITGGAVYSGQDITFEYYENGLTKSVIDNAGKMWTKYRYDGNGNRVFEGNARNFGTIAAPAWEFYQYSEAEYDAAGRLIRVHDPKSDIKYEYDAVGNRVHVWSEYQDGVGGGKQTQDLWYAYDNMNRFVVTMGTLDLATGVKATGVKGARAITYDKLGQRKSVMTGDDNVTSYFKYTYTGLIDTVSFESTLLDSTKWLAKRTYDDRGNVLTLAEYVTSGGARHTDLHTYSYEADNRLKLDVETWDGSAKSTTTTTYLGQSEDVNTVGFVSNDQSSQSYTTQYTYQNWDSAKKLSIAAIAGPEQQGNADLTYDQNGHVLRFHDRVGNKWYYYTNDADGRITRREEIDGPNADPHRNDRIAQETTFHFENYYFFNGRQIGNVAYMDAPVAPRDYAQELAQRNQTDARRPVASADFDQNYQAINSSYPGKTNSVYTVANDGETLQGVAQSMWGDGSMWYLIADANGLIGSPMLKAGQRLIIPNKVTNIHNNTSTSHPYDASEALGDINPTIPNPPPSPQPSGGGCGGVGMILMVVVMVVATVLTAGAAAVAMGATGGFWAAGMAALGSSLASGAAFAATLIGGAMGSVASQLVGMATGDVKQFSWSAVATSAIGSVVGGALPGGSSWYTAAGKAAAGSVITQQVSRGLGLQQGKFSWTSVAAAAAGGAASYGAGYAWQAQDVSFGSDFGNTLGYKSVQGVASGWASAMARHDKPNWAAIAANSFGSALGDAVVGSIQQADLERQHPVVSADEKAQILAGFADGSGDEVAGQGLRLRGGPNGNGFALTRSGAAAFDEGMDNARQARQNWESASGKVWDQEDLKYDAERRAGHRQQNLNADVVRREMAQQAVAAKQIPSEDSYYALRMSGGPRGGAGRGYDDMSPTIANSMKRGYMAPTDVFGNITDKRFILGSDAIIANHTIEEFLLGGKAIKGALQLTGAAVRGARGLLQTEQSASLWSSSAANSTGDLSQAAIRARVEANLAQSAAARNASQFDVHVARADQVRWGYAADEWWMTSLKVGDRVIGGLPGQSSYYTTAATLEASAGSRASLFESLQVKAHPEFGYRPKVGEYEVVNNSTVPFGTVRANPSLGVGGGDQFFIRNYQDSLRLIREIPLGQ